MRPEIIPVNPTYDSYWRSIAHEIFFRHTGVSTGFGCAQSFDAESNSERASPFRNHGSPEHAVQLILARWLRFYAAYEETSWTRGPRVLIEDKRIDWVAKQGQLWTALGAGKRNSRDVQSDSRLPIGSAQTLLRFLARWYGALMACVYSRETVQGIHVKESLIKSLVHMVEPLLKPPEWIRSLPEWKLMDPVHGTIPVRDIAIATTRLVQKRVILFKEGTHDDAVLLRAPKPSRTLPDSWKNSPPPLDARFYAPEDSEASTPVLGTVHVPRLQDLEIPAFEDAILCVRGFLSNKTPFFMAVRQSPPKGNWWSRPATSIFLASVMDVLRKGYNGPPQDRDKTVSRAMHLVLPFLDQETADTLLLQRLTGHRGHTRAAQESQSQAGSAATGASDATVRYRTAATQGEGNLIITPSWFPQSLARTEGLQRRTFSFAVPVRPNLGRGVHITTEIALRAAKEHRAAWHPNLGRCIKRLTHIFQVIDLQETADGIVVAFRSGGGLPWHQAFILHAPHAKTRMSQTSRAIMKPIDPPRLVKEEDHESEYHSLTQVVHESFAIPLALLDVLLLAPRDSECVSKAFRALETLSSHAVLYDTRLGINQISDVFVAWLLASKRKLIIRDTDTTEITLLCPVLQQTRTAIEDLIKFFSTHGTVPYEKSVSKGDPEISLQGFRVTTADGVSGAWGFLRDTEVIKSEDIESFFEMCRPSMHVARSGTGSVFGAAQELGLCLQPSSRVFVALDGSKQQPARGRGVVPSHLAQRIGWNALTHGLVLSPFQMQIFDQFAQESLVSLLCHLVEEADSAPTDMLSYLRFKLDRLHVD